MTKNTNKPAHTVRHGGVRATIWRNEAKSGAFYSVSFQRSFHTKDGWQETHSYGLRDLAALAACAAEAQLWLLAAERKETREAS